LTALFGTYSKTNVFLMVHFKLKEDKVNSVNLDSGSDELGHGADLPFNAPQTSKGVSLNLDDSLTLVGETPFDGSQATEPIQGCIQCEFFLPVSMPPVLQVKVQLIYSFCQFVLTSFHDECSGLSRSVLSNLLFNNV